jgi:phosphomannomutase/phosphoglucomutase
MIDQNIFREYDIRGVWEKDLTEDAVARIGRAFAAYLKRQTGRQDGLRITIGRDIRLSSDRVFAILSEVILKAGVSVTDIGVCPTPLQYFSLFTMPVDGGIMITASHNPAEFNGMKLSVGRDTLYGEQIQDIRKLVEQDVGDGAVRPGEFSYHGIIEDYLTYQKKQFTDFSGIRAVIDAGNGVGCLVGPGLISGFGAATTELFCVPDGRFPNHHPDPVVPDNLKDMIARVKAEKAHVGIGYDGDADRLGIVDEEGDMVWGDKLMIIFSRDILREHPGATIIGEVKCSKTMYDDIRGNGGNAIMWKTGHSLIKSKMKETGALLAGEMSGHLFFKDRYFGYDDALYASFRLLEILKRNGPPYSVRRLLEGVPQMTATPEIRIECPDDKKFTVVEKMKEALKNYTLITIDGVRVEFPDGWGLVRASNTQPALVMRFEATNGESLKKIRDMVEGELKKLL